MANNKQQGGTYQVNKWTGTPPQTSPAQPLSTDSIPDSVPRESRFTGEVAYIYAYDLAYDMHKSPYTTLLGQPVQDYAMGASKRSPKQFFFYRPQMITLPEQTITLEDHGCTAQGSIKVFNIGAISLLVRIPFAVDRLTDLVHYHQWGSDSFPVQQLAYELGLRVLHELGPHCIRPVTDLGPAEAYTVFCLYHWPVDAESPSASDWLQRHREQVAALLTEEEAPTALSQQEIEESTQAYQSYYQDDLVVVDWDAALIMGDIAGTADVLHIMEMANVQLLELGVYDRLLDTTVEGAYRDVTVKHWHRRLAAQQQLREIQVDMTHLNDELLNITKFFGDWHLARVYQHLANRFHLADWHQALTQKLNILAHLYQLLREDRNTWLMLTLETTIVLLFILDVVLLMMGI